MSYSFIVTGSTSKADAIAKVTAEFDQVVASQPTHAADKNAAVAAASAFIGLLQEPRDDQQIDVTMNGSLGWVQSGDLLFFLSGNVSVSASLVPKAAAA